MLSLCYYFCFCCYIEPSLSVAIGSISAIPFIVTDVFEDITVHDVVVPFVLAPVLLLIITFGWAPRFYNEVLNLTD